MKKLMEQMDQTSLWSKRILVGLDSRCYPRTRCTRGDRHRNPWRCLCKRTEGDRTIFWYSFWLSVLCVTQGNPTAALSRQLSYFTCSVLYWPQSLPYLPAWHFPVKLTLATAALQTQQHHRVLLRFSTTFF